MDYYNFTSTHSDFQPPGVAELERILDGVDVERLLEKLAS